MNSFCAYFNHGQCQSCQLIGMNYLQQLQHKEQQLKVALGEFSGITYLPSTPSPMQQFRNKAKFSVTGTVSDPIIGLLGEKDFDQGREILNCPIHVPAINAIVSQIRTFIQTANLSPYHISQRRGELKSLIIFYSQNSKEMYLRFICRSKEPVTRIQKFLPQLLQQVPELKCVSINIQPIPHAILEGEEEIILTDKKYISHQFNKIEMQLGPRAFVQTNQQVAEKLYQTASEWIKELEIESFMELFCGQGAFSFFAAPHIKSGLGIEINEFAVDIANQTAQDFHFDHLKFKSADAGSVAAEINQFNPNLILVNPPRKGLGNAVQLIQNFHANHIIYSSCSYESLAADLQQLKNHYQISRVQIFDMFPHTQHFETLVLLTKI